MGLFNFFKPKPTPTPEQKSSSETPAQGNQWDDLTRMQFQDRESSQESPAEKSARIKRQGDKIIATYLHGPESIDQYSVEVSDADRTKVLEDLQSGAFSTEAQSKLLQHIALPSDSAGRHHDYGYTLKSIGDKHGMKILAYTAGMDVNYVNRITGQESADQRDQILLRDLLTKYPTPIEFAPREEAMLSDLARSGNTPAKIAEYKDAFEQFKQNVYGKRYEYFQALDVLKDDAAQHSAAQVIASDQPRRDAESQQLQTPVMPSPEQIQDNPYASPELRQAAQAASPVPKQAPSAHPAAERPAPTPQNPHRGNPRSNSKSDW